MVQPKKRLYRNDVSAETREKQSAAHQGRRHSNDTKLDQKTALSTMITCTESMTRSFEDMKNTKATEVPVSLCKTQAVKTIVREQVKEALKELDMKAEVSPDYYERMNKLIKRPQLLSLHLNLTAKAFSIIMALLVVLGAAGYVWFVNTPMYLGDELYKSYARLNYPNPGAGYSTAYRLIEAGERKQLKDEIRRSEHREHSYIAHRDTLRQLLNDQSIFINHIQYENSERLIDYTDSTDVIKIAHFRKDESIRITDSPEVVTLHDARSTKKVKWKKVR